MGSDALLARTGRLRQRYYNQLRLVAGCVPYKLNQNSYRDDDLVNRLQVLMISSPNRHDLVFPKGGWENDETEKDAACREALEEAGVRGTIRGTLGVWDFRSKSRQNSSSSSSSSSLEGTCRGLMFALEVTELLPSWPEKASHERRWLTVNEARRLCRYDWMREALENCLKLLSGETLLPQIDTSIYCYMNPSEKKCLERSETSNFCHMKPSENNKHLESSLINALC